MTKSERNGAWRRALELTAPIGRNPLRTLPAIVHAMALQQGAAPALIGDSETLDYSNLARRMDHYARWAITQQLGKGAVIALFMANSPDYLAIWLGLTRIGCIVALVNTNLRGASLGQAIALVSPTHMIVGAPLAEACAPVAATLEAGCELWVHGADTAGFARIDDGGADQRPLAPDELAIHAPSIRNPALYLYTSGTTGLPKAVPVSHYRLMQWSFWFAGMIDVKPDDRMYNCLPMYHSVGGIVANGAMLVRGGSVVVRERFSASRFWTDIAGSGCTLFQYIGEMCRFLVNGPAEPPPGGHHIRLACGNGLRADVWETLQARFAIPKILEFYAATEGNISLYNVEGQPGSIGRIPSFLAHRFPLALVSFDVETGQPMRGDDGFCRPCATDEPGEAIGRIPDDEAGLAGRFEGYLDPVATQAKILRDVFASGDAWYRTGDLMRRDRAGFHYFVDRIGDTFRWKGENVSTEEVAAVIATCPGVASAVVYGVTIPHHDGRAGMAAIVTGIGFDLALLDDLLAERLPDYARPVFLRLLPGIEVTGTFKPLKQQLMQEAYQLSLITEPLFVRTKDEPRFSALDGATLEAIVLGETRL